MSEQRSPEWFAERLGKVTASRVADLMAKTKSGYSTSRNNYMAELICERLTGQPTERYSNAQMQWGTDQEPVARANYELMQGVNVLEVGFEPHPTILMFGASPDGLVGATGLVEIKCPNTATHIETLLGGSVDGKYLTQMQVQMMCTDRDWCDFVSFDPRLPVDMQLFIRRIWADAVKQNEIQNEVSGFLLELEEKLAVLLLKYKTAA